MESNRISKLKQIIWILEQSPAQQGSLFCAFWAGSPLHNSSNGNLILPIWLSSFLYWGQVYPPTKAHFYHQAWHINLILFCAWEPLTDLSQFPYSALSRPCCPGLCYLLQSSFPWAVALFSVLSSGGCPSWQRGGSRWWGGKREGLWALEEKFLPRIDLPDSVLTLGFLLLSENLHQRIYLCWHRQISGMVTWHIAWNMAVFFPSLFT